MNKYDAIVIGAGLGGLSTAARLVKSNKRVLVIDQHYVVGGCASTFRRRKYIFDAAVHLMGGCKEDDILGNLFLELGLADKVEFVEINPMYVASIGEEKYDIPSNLFEFEKELCKWFPLEKEGIIKVFSIILRMGTFLLDDDSAKTRTKEESATLLKELFTIRRLSFVDFLSTYITDPKAISIITSLFIYAGVPPKGLSTPYIISVLMSYHNGAFYPKGSTQVVANNLKEYIESNGSSVVLRRKVEKILASDNQVKGIVDHKGEEYHSNIIVSNADMESTYLHLLGEEYLSPKYISKLKKLTPSCSAIVLYAGIRDDDNWTNSIPHELFLIPHHEDQNPHYFYHPNNNSLTPMSICCPSHVDSNLAPEGHSIITITALCDYKEIEEIRLEKGKNYILKDFLDRIEKYLPGFTERLVIHELATPSTIHRYTQNQNGAMYGWNKDKDQPWFSKMGPLSPIKGLYFTGHWTNNIHGVYGVVKSGIITSQEILKKEIKHTEGERIYD